MSPSVPPLTLEEVADHLGVHYMTAYRYVRTGRLAATKVGKRWLVTADDLADLAETSREPGGAPPTSPASRARYPAMLRSRLLAADEAGAWDVIDQAMASGVEPTAVLLEVIGPALSAIGTGWEAGDVSIAMEHQATATATRLVSRLGPRFAVRGPARGTVLLGAAPGDHHALPSAMLRDVLRGRHLAVTDLGANVPVESWSSATVAAAEASPALVAVGIGAMAGTDLKALADAVAAVRAATDVPIVVGGAGIRDATEAQRIGADHHSTSSRQAVNLLDPSGPAI